MKYKGKVTGRLLILLDSGATHHIVCNSAILTNICPAEKLKTMVTNAGVMRVDKKGQFPGIGEVYYHPSAVINVLSFGILDEDTENFDVTHVKGSHFIVKNKKTGKNIKFVNEGGIYVAHVDAGKLYSRMCKNTKYDITPTCLLLFKP